MYSCAVLPVSFLIIPGTTKLHQLEEILGSAKVTLTADDPAQIGEALTSIDVQGARYPEGAQKMTDR